MLEIKKKFPCPPVFAEKLQLFCIFLCQFGTAVFFPTYGLPRRRRAFHRLQEVRAARAAAEQQAGQRPSTASGVACH